MGILADFEDSIGKVIEGTFGGIFRSHVQPAEIARVCAKEMDRSKKLGVGKVYVANFYNVILSPRDGEALSGLMNTLGAELETYLLAHSRENNYQLPTHPAVRFITDPELRLGKFDVIGEIMSQDEIDKELGIFVEPPATPAAVVSNATPLVPEPAPPTAPVEVVIGEGEEEDIALAAELVSPATGSIPLGELDSYTIGRKDTCDIQLQDSAVSRLHATISNDGRHWILTDNEATNTTQVNGYPITTRHLSNGDVITIGTTQLTFRKIEPAPVPVPLIEPPIMTTPEGTAIFVSNQDPL